MWHPDHFRTFIGMTATAAPKSPVSTPTVQLAWKGQRNRNTLNRHLVAILLAAVAAAFFVSVLTARPPAGTPQPYAPAVGHPGPASFEEILSRQNRNAKAPDLAAPRSASAQQ
jgi:hypothetical protein